MKYGIDNYGRYKEDASGERYAIEVFPPWHRFFTFRSVIDYIKWVIFTN